MAGARVSGARVSGARVSGARVSAPASAVPATPATRKHQHSAENLKPGPFQTLHETGHIFLKFVRLNGRPGFDTEVGMGFRW